MFMYVILRTEQERRKDSGLSKNLCLKPSSLEEGRRHNCLYGKKGMVKMKIVKILASISAIFLMTAGMASAELLFEENFEDENWKESWTVSSTPAMRTDYVMSGDKA